MSTKINGKLKKKKSLSETPGQKYLAELFLWGYSTTVLKPCGFIKKKRGCQKVELLSLYVNIENFENNIFFFFFFSQKEGTRFSNNLQEWPLKGPL